MKTQIFSSVMALGLGAFAWAGSGQLDLPSRYDNPIVKTVASGDLMDDFEDGNLTSSLGGAWEAVATSNEDGGNSTITLAVSQNSANEGKSLHAT